jgi:hypothetical protein
MMPVTIDLDGIGKWSPAVSMRGPERLAIGAANRMVKRLGIGRLGRSGDCRHHCRDSIRQALDGRGG